MSSLGEEARRDGLSWTPKMQEEGEWWGEGRGPPHPHPEVELLFLCLFLS